MKNTCIQNNAENLIALIYVDLPLECLSYTVKCIITREVFVEILFKMRSYTNELLCCCKFISVTWLMLSLCAGVEIESLIRSLSMVCSL